MIVDSMTHAEAYRELDADKDAVTRWTDYRYDEYRRRALKTHKFPVTWWLDYTSPRKNRYMMSVICTRRNFDRNHVYLVIALRREERGHTVYLTSLNHYSHVRRTVLVQHVFDRYAERAHVDKRGLDLIRHFFDHLSSGTIITDQRFAARSVRYKGRDHKFVAINEGIMLGNVEDGIFIVRTFITYDMTTGEQRKAFAEARSKILDTNAEVRYVNDLLTTEETLLT